MAKDSYYFSHDYNAREDEKIKELIFEHGMFGYGIYWAIIEMLYQNANALRTNYKRIAFELRVDEKTVKSIVSDYNLFVIDGECFFSNSVKRRLEERENKSKKARDSALQRWSKKENNANALQQECERNAIKERKEKKRKGNNILLEKETKENLLSEVEFSEEVEPEKEERKKVAPKKERFKPPTVQEVQEYCNERQNGIQAYKFVDFYQSKGWKVGNQPMKDWKAAIRTWENKNKENGNTKTNAGSSASEGKSRFSKFTVDDFIIPAENY